MTWKRPPSVPFPSVWSHHVGTRALSGGQIPKFRIQDAPAEIYEEVVDFMCTHFLAGEPLCTSTNLMADATSMAEIRAMWVHALQDKMALVALEESDDGATRLAGVNVTCVALAEERKREYEFEGGPMKKVLTLIQHMSDQVNVFERYGVTEYLTAYGLSVAAEYQGQGLGLALLRARTPLCKATGLGLTATVFTANNSQELARRAGFEFVYEVAYIDQKDEEGKELFPGINAKLCITMALKIE